MTSRLTDWKRMLSHKRLKLCTSRQHPGSAKPHAVIEALTQGRQDFPQREGTTEAIIHTMTTDQSDTSIQAPLETHVEFTYNTPFACLQLKNNQVIYFQHYILVLALGKTIVLKCKPALAWVTNDPGVDAFTISVVADGYTAEDHRSAKAEIEKMVASRCIGTEHLLALDARRSDAIQERLQERHSGHILCPTLITNEGIFTPRCLDFSLNRLDTESLYFAGVSTKIPVPFRTRLRWIHQLAKAVAWLESIRICHNDLRASNILVDRYDSIVITDFGNCSYWGELHETARPPECLNFGAGGRESELWSVGWRIYSILGGRAIPQQTIEQKIEPARKLLPNTEDMAFGDIMQKCWYNEYRSLSAMQVEVDEIYQHIQPWYFRILDFTAESRAALYSWQQRQALHYYTRELYVGLPIKQY